MSNFRNNIKSALESAKFHGHVLGKGRYPDHDRYSNTCKVCGAFLLVERKPLPNSTFVMGRAVAVGCSKKEQKN